MNVWITGGGTREPIDSVRFIGNRSSGALALQLMAAASARDHQVTAYLADYVVTPKVQRNVSVVRFNTADSLGRALLKDSKQRPDVLIHAAAVADYAPEPISGKTASGRQSWTLTLKPLPKLVTRFRERYPGTTILLFKLETGISRAELKSRALKTARNARAEFVFGNLLEALDHEHRGWLFDAKTGAERAFGGGKKKVAEQLVEALERA